MNITFLIGSLRGGGAERVVCNLANHFSEKYHEVTILTMEDSKSFYLLDEKVEHKPLLKKLERRNKIYNLLIRAYRIKKYIKTHNGEKNVFVVFLPITTIILLILKGKSNSHFIVSERGNPASYPTIQKLLLKSLAPKATTYVFQTNEIRNWYGDSVCDNNAFIIPNAINNEFMREEYKGTKDKIIIAIGRLSKSKNFPLLLEAFMDVSKQFPEYRLFIYGDGPDKETLENQIKMLNLYGKVVLAGQNRNISNKLEKATLFVLSSNNEGMPNALIEAMALGVPCIATDCAGGGARELIKNMENGILVDRGNKDQLANSITLLLKDKELRDKLGKNARRISEILSPNKIYSMWDNIITR